MECKNVLIASTAILAESTLVLVVGTLVLVVGKEILVVGKENLRVLVARKLPGKKFGDLNNPEISKKSLPNGRLFCFKTN